MRIRLRERAERQDTSTAKILAKAVNRLNPKNGDPCSSASLPIGCKPENTDIMEIAASNNSVDSIRSCAIW